MILIVIIGDDSCKDLLVYQEWSRGGWWWRWE